MYFKHIMLSSNMHGQKHRCFEKTMKFYKKNLNKKYGLQYISCNDSLQRNLENIYDFNMGVNGTRLNIGGDHSMSIATGACSLNTYPHTKFIWIDAHPDLNTYKSSITKNFHGMPVAYLSGQTSSLYPMHFQFIRNQLQYKNLLYIGIRSIDEYEESVIRDCNINVIKSRSCNNDINNVIQQVSDFAGKSPLHVSFDVDSLDPSVMPSTGTPVKEGLRKSTAKKLLNHIVNNTNLINMDFTELNLSLGTPTQQKISETNALDIMRSLKLC